MKQVIATPKVLSPDPIYFGFKLISVQSFAQLNLTSPFYKPLLSKTLFCAYAIAEMGYNLANK